TSTWRGYSTRRAPALCTAPPRPCTSNPPFCIVLNGFLVHRVESHVPEVSTRVLVVDDDPTFATFVCTIVEREGVRPEVSPTGADAMRRLARDEFGGVLLDLKLPDIDGLTV